MDYDGDRRVLRESWKGSFRQSEVPVHGGTTVRQGDLLFLDKANKLRDKGTSNADWYAYPFGDISGSTRTLESNKALAAKYFIGVAGWHSDYGVTETISVYTKGLFRYPLRNSRHVKIGQYVIPTGTGVTLYSQHVAVESSTSSYIGLAGDCGQFKSTVDMVILPRLSGVSPEI